MNTYDNFELVSITLYIFSLFVRAVNFEMASKRLAKKLEINMKFMGDFEPKRAKRNESKSIYNAAGRIRRTQLWLSVIVWIIGVLVAISHVASAWVSNVATNAVKIAMTSSMKFQLMARLNQKPFTIRILAKRNYNSHFFHSIPKNLRKFLCLKLKKEKEKSRKFNHENSQIYIFCSVESVSNEYY